MEGVLEETLNEIILTCMDYDVVFKLERKLKELIDFTVKRRGFWRFFIKVFKEITQIFLT